MRKTIIVLAVSAVSGVALATETIRVMYDLPPGKGRWKLEVIEGGPGVQQMGPMTVCTDAGREMRRYSRKSPSDGPPAKGKRTGPCKTTLVQNSSKVAEIEEACGEVVSTTVIRRLGKGQYQVEAHYKSGKKAQVFKAQYSYVGPCAEGGAPELTMERDSPQCQQLRETMKLMDTSICASLEGKAKADCEAKMQESLNKISAMCPE